MDKMVTIKKIGIIGLGTISQYYLTGLENSKFLKLVSVCDISDSAVSKEVFSKYPFYLNYQEMVEAEKLDYVIISTPPKSHFEMAKYCLSKNVNVIVEKPGTLSYSSFLELEKFASSKKLIFEVMYHWQNGSEVLRFTEMYDAKKIEKIEVEIEDPYSQDGETILDSKCKLEGAWIDSGVNALSMLKLWFPFNKVRVNKKEVIRCQKSDFPIFVLLDINIDGIPVKIKIDWRNHKNDKKTTMTYEGKELVIYHSKQSIILFQEEVFSSMERLATHYYNYFKNYSVNIKKEDSKKIHKVLFAINDKL
jgi:hypothetical protein